MDETQARQQCERLRNLINRGKDPSALRAALCIVDALRQAAAPYPCSRLTWSRYSSTGPSFALSRVNL